MYIRVHLPDEVAHYEPELRKFFELMVQKMYVNRHKGFGEGVDLSTFLGLIKGELDELTNAIDNEGQFQALVECADVANLAALTAMRLTRMTRADFEEERRS